MMKRNDDDTLCWYCKNAVPSERYGCAWSERGKPVDGWNAEETEIANTRGTEAIKYITKSYKILSCPEFKEG